MMWFENKAKSGCCQAEFIYTEYFQQAEVSLSALEKK